MVISLNEIVTILSERVGRQFDESFKEELKQVVNYKRANFFKKLINQNPTQRRYFLKEFVVQLEKVDKVACPFNVGCSVLKTTMDVPLPIRTGGTFFDFVGTVDGEISFKYSTPDQSVFYRFSKYTKNSPQYYYTNNRLFIFNTLKPDYIKVRGVFTDPRELQGFVCNDGTTLCYTDDDKYDIPEDLINDIIRDVLTVELRVLMQEKEETKLDEKNT